MTEQAYSPGPETRWEGEARHDWAEQEFLRYREIIEDRCIGSRLTGLQTLESTQAAMADSISTSTMIVKGVKIPAIVDIDYAVGAHYEPGRCRELVAGGDQELIDNTFYYAGHAEPNRDELATLDLRLPQKGQLFFDYDESDITTPIRLQAMLLRAGYKVTEAPILDTRVAPKNQQAQITLHEVENPYADFTSTKTLAEMAAPYAEGGEKAEKWGDIHSEKGGTRLVMGPDLDAKTTDALWDIYSRKFDLLGEHHPLRMEDIERDSLEMLQSADTVVSIHYRNGMPVCFGFSIEGTDQLDWMSQHFLDQKLALRPGERPLFLPAIVAAEEHMGDSSHVIGIMSEMLMDQNAPERLFFECTNKTKVAIPMMLRRFSQAVGANIAPPNQIDAQIFNCLQFERSGSRLAAQKTLAARTIAA